MTRCASTPAIIMSFENLSHASMLHPLSKKDVLLNRPLTPERLRSRHKQGGRKVDKQQTQT